MAAYTISYIQIGIDFLYDFVCMNSYYFIPHTRYSHLSTLSLCCHSHDSGCASKDSDSDDDDYDDDVASKEDDGDDDDGDDDGEKQNGGENEHVVLNVNYKQERLMVNFSGLTSHLAYCYDPPLGPFSECYCILYMLRVSEQMTTGTPSMT
jgi:hypothetical protein